LTGSGRTGEGWACPNELDCQPKLKAQNIPPSL